MLDFTELNDNENKSTRDVPTRIDAVTSIFMYIYMHYGHLYIFYIMFGKFFRLNFSSVLYVENYINLPILRNPGPVLLI